GCVERARHFAEFVIAEVTRRRRELALRVAPRDLGYRAYAIGELGRREPREKQRRQQASAERQQRNAPDGRELLLKGRKWQREANECDGTRFDDRCGVEEIATGRAAVATRVAEASPAGVDDFRTVAVIVDACQVVGVDRRIADHAARAVDERHAGARQGRDAAGFL